MRQFAVAMTEVEELETVKQALGMAAEVWKGMSA